MANIIIYEKSLKNGVVNKMEIARKGVVKAAPGSSYHFVVDGVALTPKNAVFKKAGKHIVVEKNGEVVAELDCGLNPESASGNLNVTADGWCTSAGDASAPAAGAPSSGGELSAATSAPAADGVEVAAASTAGHEGAFNPWMLGGMVLGGGGAIAAVAASSGGSSGPAAAAPTTRATITGIDNDSGTVGDFITNDKDGLVVKASLSAALASGEKLMYSNDNGVTWADVTSSVSGSNVSYADSHLTSTATVKFKVVNSAGAAGATASQLVTIVTTVEGAVTAGQMLTGNSLRVTLYKADGTTELGSSTVDGQGHYSVNVGNYSGGLIATVSAGVGDHIADFKDEATNSDKDLNAILSAVSFLPANYANSTYLLNLSPLTTAAGRVCQGMDGGLIEGNISLANHHVAQALGMSNLDVTTADAGGEIYAAMLAAFSGLDFKHSGAMETAIDDLVSRLSGAVLSGTGKADLLQGAVIAKYGNPTLMGEVVNAVSDALYTGSAEVSINDIVGDDIIDISEKTGTLTITGGVAAGTTRVTLTLNNDAGASVAASGNVTITGANWSYDLTADDFLALGRDGVKEIVATAYKGSTEATASRLFWLELTTPDVEEISMADASLKAGETTTLTFTFNEAPIGFTADDVTCDNGVLSGFAVTSDPCVYTATFTPNAGIEDTSNVISVSINYSDSGHHRGAGATSGNYVVDTKAANAPQITSVSDDVTPVTGTVSSGGATNDVSPTVHVSLADTNAVAGDTVQLYNGAAALGAAVTLTADHISAVAVDITPTGLAGGAYSVTAKVTDQAGNVGAASTAVAFTVDATPPTVNTTTLSMAENSTAAQTLTANEAVTWSLGTMGDVFNLDSSTGALSFKGPKNYEVDGHAYTVNVIASDAAGNATTKAVTVNLTDVNEAPPIVANPISDQTFVVNNDNAFIVPANTFTDADTYSTLIGSAKLADGSALPSWLTFDPASRTFSGKPAEAGTITVRVTVSDGDYSATDDFTITSRSEPVVADLTVSDQTTPYSLGKVGDSVRFTVFLTEKVSSTGTLTAHFDVNGHDVAATASMVSHTDNITFTGTLPSGDGTNISLTSLVADSGHITGDYSGRALIVPTSGAVKYSGYTVDNTAPGKTAVSIVDDAGLYTGTVANNGVTDDTLPTVHVDLTGAGAVAGDTAAVYYKAGSASYALLGSATLTAADITAHYVNISSRTLTDATTYTLEARVDDQAGNLGSYSDIFSFTVDTTGPAATTSITGITVNSSSTNFLTNDHDGLTVKGNLSTALVTGEKLMYSDDNGGHWADISNAITSRVVGGNTVYEWSYDDNALTSTATVKSMVIDAAGNAGGAASQVITIDTTPPSAPTVNLAHDTGSGATDRITRDGSLSVTGTETGATVEYSVNGTDWASSFTAQAGSNTVYVHQIDAAGNAGNSSSLSFTLDNAAPTATVSLTKTVFKGGETDTVTIQFSEAVSGFDLTDLAVVQTNTGTLSNLNTSDNITWTALFTPSSATESATNYIQLTASSYADLAGNTGGTAKSDNYAIDTSAPGQPSINFIDNAGSSTGTVPNGGVTDDASPTVHVSLANTHAVANDYVYLSRNGSVVDAHRLTSSECSSGYVDITPSDNLVNGTTYTFSAKLVDGAGNIGESGSAAITINTDTSAPTVTNPSALDGVANLDVTSDIVLNFGGAVTAVSGGRISIVNDANTGAKNGYGGENATHTIELYLDAAHATTNGGVTTVRAYQDSNHTTESGTVTIGSTGLVTLNPLYDLDLSNNYHIEIAANTFQKTTGVGNLVFGTNGTDLNFSTVGPGVVSSSGSLANVATSGKMTADGAMGDGHQWISLDGVTLGNESALKVLDLSGKDYALVLKDASTAVGELGLATSTNIALGNMEAGHDLLYFDDQNNAGSIALASNVDQCPDGYTQTTPASLMLTLYAPINGVQVDPSFIAFIGVNFDADLSVLAGRVIIA